MQYQEECVDQEAEVREEISEKTKKECPFYRSRYLDVLSAGRGYEFDYRTFAGRSKILI